MTTEDQMNVAASSSPVEVAISLLKWLRAQAHSRVDRYPLRETGRVSLLGAGKGQDQVDGFDFTRGLSRNRSAEVWGHAHQQGRRTASAGLNKVVQAGDAEPAWVGLSMLLLDIRWAQLRPTAEGIALIVHEAMDVGDEDHCDLGTFPCFGREDGEEDFGLQLAVTDDAHAALAIAEGKIGADRSRWVNEGVAGAEYREYVRAGRPSAFLGDAARSNACPG
jgi:hypothetical protein